MVETLPGLPALVAGLPGMMPRVASDFLLSTLSRARQGEGELEYEIESDLLALGYNPDENYAGGLREYSAEFYNEKKVISTMYQNISKLFFNVWQQVI